MAPKFAAYKDQVYFKEHFSLRMLKFDLVSFILVLRWLETTIMDIGDELQKVSRYWTFLVDLGLILLWHILHFIISTWYFTQRVAQTLENILVAYGFYPRYKTLNISKVRYLAVVIDSEEAKQASKVLQLLHWLTAIGVRKVCLYDTQGVLQKSKEITEAGLTKQLSLEEAIMNDLFGSKKISLEFVSFSDGKEAVTKAANFLFEKKYMSAEDKPNFTESTMAEALGAIGCGGMEPDLLLVYGPARCHLGFPAWRIRYTEIVHMGSLKHMKFGTLVKAIHGFTMVHQNYGT